MKKISLSLLLFCLVLFNWSFVGANFITDLWDFWTVFVDIWLFLWALVKFIIFWLKTCLNLIWKAFTYIFSPELFDWISDVFQNLVVFMWAPAATAFVGLFFIAFLLIFVSFIYRFIKGSVSYNTALKKFYKQK